ncbi:hypothetical protein QO001_002181 [Methylobacterium brachiatum]|uniref:Uncharacterized protein n=1 Tax=Methylobacterium brachiatum TaxID=269660 RepID=A0AAJ1WWI3_9HYPH|nr:hypothetical protein [Methylobacterium brachiatum]MCB4802629.1 hypothetical protein [Methylobacterium brachiatum]MDQ0543255.1 hypothetical protein [Methylobacterium brachiatum]
MSEQYDLAAWRHQGTADHLLKNSEFDDAGYHYGIVGENALKHAMRSSGIEAYFLANPPQQRNGRRRSGDPLRGTPLRGHFPSLQALAIQAQQVVSLYATGRVAAALQTEIGSAAFNTRFQSWSIDIRYASTTCTPVTQAVCDTWKKDAEDLILRLVI